MMKCRCSIPVRAVALNFGLGIALLFAGLNLYSEGRDLRKFLPTDAGRSSVLRGVRTSSSSFIRSEDDPSTTTTKDETTSEESSPPTSSSRTALAYHWPRFKHNNNTSSSTRMAEAQCEGDSDNHVLRVPTFIVPGAQKAGTSAIYNLLGMHPHVIASRRFEVHFFDYRLHGIDTSQDPASVSDADICERRKAYQTEFDVETVQQYYHDKNIRVATFEKSPRYLCYPHIPGFVKRITPWTKVLITLRNPIDRAYSQYKMDEMRKPIAKRKFQTFEENIQRDVEQLRRVGLSQAPPLNDWVALQQEERSPDDETKGNADFDLPVNQTLLERIRDVSHDSRLSRIRAARRKRTLLLDRLPRGFYAQQIGLWLDHFELGKDMIIVQYEKLKADEPRVFRQILEFIGVDPNAWEVDNKVFKKDFSPSKKIETPMNNATRMYLQKLYKPYNDELADLLGEEWRDIWQ